MCQNPVFRFFDVSPRSKKQILQPTVFLCTSVSLNLEYDFEINSRHTGSFSQKSLNNAAVSLPVPNQAIFPENVWQACICQNTLSASAILANSSKTPSARLDVPLWASILNMAFISKKARETPYAFKSYKATTHVRSLAAKSTFMFKTTMLDDVCSQNHSITLLCGPTTKNLSKALLKIHMSINVAATFPCAIGLRNLLKCSKRRYRIHIRPKSGQIILYAANDSKNCNSASCGLSVSPLLSVTIEYTLKSIRRYLMSKNIVRALACAFGLQNLLVCLKEGLRRCMCPKLSRLVWCAAERLKNARWQNMFSLSTVPKTPLRPAYVSVSKNTDKESYVPQITL